MIAPPNIRVPCLTSLAPLSGFNSDCQYFLIVWKTFPFLSFYQFAAYLPQGIGGIRNIGELLEWDWSGPSSPGSAKIRDYINREQRSVCMSTASLSYWLGESVLTHCQAGNWILDPGSCDDAKWKLLQTKREREEREDHICIETTIPAVLTSGNFLTLSTFYIGEC